MRIKVFFTESSSIPEIKKIVAVGEKQLHIKRVVNDVEEVADFNFANLSDGKDFRTSRDNTVYTVEALEDSTTFIKVLGGVSTGQSLPENIDVTQTAFPFYPYLAAGETETSETADATPSSLPTAPGYAEHQQDAIDAYNTVWLSQKRAWMAEAVSYADGVPDIVAQVGYYMKAADAFIKARFQDPTIAPDVVVAVIEKMAAGALDIDSVSDFAGAIRQYKSLWPNGPTQALGWVSISGSTVSRVNLADAVQLGVESLPSDFNSFDTSWLVANQPGSVSLSSTSPIVGTAVAATVSDPDGGVSSTTWQWQNKTSGGEWTDISDATAASYTPVSGDVGKTLRATATYTDNAATGNTATSAETGTVGNA